MAFTQVAVTGTFRNADGSPAVGRVTFTPITAMRNSTGGAVTTVQSTVTEVLDADGELATTLAATDDAGTTPTGVTYLVREYLRFQLSASTPPVTRYFIEVPHDGGPIDLGSVARATPVTPEMAAYLTRDAADALYEPLGGGGGEDAVDSVNGETGTVVLDAADVGAATPGRAAALALILGS